MVRPQPQLPRLRCRGLPWRTAPRPRELLLSLAAETDGATLKAALHQPAACLAASHARCGSAGRSVQMRVQVEVPLVAQCRCESVMRKKSADGESLP